MTFKYTVLLAFLFGLLITVQAHKQTRRALDVRSLRSVFAATSSTCGYMTCAVAGGNCANDGSALTFCPANQYCDGTKCQSKLASGASCSTTSADNQCGNGESCIDAQDGRGAVCQIYRSIMPGNPCSADSQCFYSDNADGSAPRASTCSNGFCAGIAVGTACSASHQCVVGSFCNGVCTTIGQVGATCSDDSQCDSSLTCFSSKCSRPYTQTTGATCQTTENCAPGLYCKSGTCQAGSNVGDTAQACDIQGNSCGADQTCQCSNFTTQGLTATCHGIAGTPADMDNIYKNAYSCLADHKCGTDANNAANVKCINDNCLNKYCTYLTRIAPELFDEYPSCLVSRMVSNSNYYDLLQKCQAYKPGGKGDSTGAGAVINASFAWVLLVALATFFFAL